MVRQQQQQQQQQQHLRRRPRPSGKIRTPPMLHPLIAFSLLCWQGDASRSDSSLPSQTHAKHRRSLPQHWVPPFRGSPRLQDLVPFCSIGAPCHDESKNQETFHFIHVQGNSSISQADDVFQRLRKRMEAATATAPANDKVTTVKSKSRRMGFLRGLFDGSAVFDIVSQQKQQGKGLALTGGRFLDSPWSDEGAYTISAETEFANSTGRGTDGGGGIENAPYANTAINPGNNTDQSDGSKSSSVHTKGEQEKDTGNSTNPGGQSGSGNSSNNKGKLGKKFHPIRIRAILSESSGGGQHLAPAELYTLMEDMVRPALLAWSEALRVPSTGEGKNLTLDPSQWVDGKTCGPGIGSGLPTAHVPKDHIIYGVPETDLVVYLNLGFVQEPTVAPTTSPATSEPSSAWPTTDMPFSVPSSSKENHTSASPSEISSEPAATTAPITSYDSTVWPFTSTPSPFTSGMPTNPKSFTTDRIPTTAAIDDSSTATTGPDDTAATGGAKDIKDNGNYTEQQQPPETAEPTSIPSYFPTTLPTSLPATAEPSLTPSIIQQPTLSPSPPPVPKPKCAGDYLASSVFCSTNELDRPTAALLHICIGSDFFDDKRLSRNILTIMHELGHSLGFNVHSLAHFRRSDGTPLTERDSTGAVIKKNIQCTGPEVSGGRPWAEILLPSPEILKFRTVRGGVRVAEVVTPSVAQVVRNHFDCQELQGAELESGEFLPLSTNPGEMSCLGNHWERRLFKMDLMNPIVDELPFDSLISILTLAYFADSGWYQVDLSRAGVAAVWGRAAGCAFVEEPCIQGNGEILSGSDSLFCNSLSKFDSAGFVTTLDGCTPDLTKKAVCTMSQYLGELPENYQYFSETLGSNVGGLDPFMDYCPVYNGVKNGLCSDSANEAVLRLNAVERIGSRNSRCLGGNAPAKGGTAGKLALCLRIACVVEDKSLRVQVDGKWHTCSHEGQRINSWSRETVICPDPIRVCPTFYCPRNCLGTQRVCDYNLGACVCSYPGGGVKVPSSDGSCPPALPTTVPGNFSSGKTGGETGRENNGVPGSDKAPSGSPGAAETKSTTATGSPNFYIPPDKADDDPTIPKSGTPLEDIYFLDERTLQQDYTQSDLPTDKTRRHGAGSADDWRWWGLLGFLIFVFPAFTIFKKSKHTVGSNDDGGGGDNSPAATTLPPEVRRNKDKMIATVLVDLRINDPNFVNFRDVLVQRGSETDRSMTDTDPGTFTPWEDQPSAEFSSTAEQSEDHGVELPSILEPFESCCTVSTIPPSEEPDTPLGRPSLRGNTTIRRRFFRRQGNNRPGAIDRLRL